MDDTRVDVIVNEDASMVIILPDDPEIEAYIRQFVMSVEFPIDFKGDVEYIYRSEYIHSEEE